MLNSFNHKYILYLTIWLSAINHHFISKWSIYILKLLSIWLSNCPSIFLSIVIFIHISINAYFYVCIIMKLNNIHQHVLKLNRSIYHANLLFIHLSLCKHKAKWSSLKCAKMKQCRKIAQYCALTNIPYYNFGNLGCSIFTLFLNFLWEIWQK